MKNYSDNQLEEMKLIYKDYCTSKQYNHASIQVTMQVTDTPHISSVSGLQSNLCIFFMCVHFFTRRQIPARPSSKKEIQHPSGIDWRGISREFTLQKFQSRMSKLPQLHNLTVHATAWAQYFSLALTSSGSSPVFESKWSDA